MDHDFLGKIADGTKAAGIKTGKTEELPAGCMNYLVGFTLVFLVLIPLNIFGLPFVFMVLANWFLPVLGLPMISFPMAMGIMLLYRTLTFDLAKAKKAANDDSEVKKYTEQPITMALTWISQHVFAWAFALGWGYCITLFL